jgi:hypothetical protein
VEDGCGFGSVWVHCLGLLVRWIHGDGYVEVMCCYSSREVVTGIPRSQREHAKSALAAIHRQVNEGRWS